MCALPAEEDVSWLSTIREALHLAVERRAVHRGVAGACSADCRRPACHQSARTRYASLSEMVPAPGQGALAIETRKEEDLTELVGAIDDKPLRTLVLAERLLLAETGAGCRSALGALATWEGRLIRMDAYASDERGPRRALARGETPEAVVAECRKALDL